MNPLNNKLSAKDGGLKFLIAWLGVLLVRLVPFRPPNVEPMLSCMMPVSKKYGAFTSFLFGFFGILILDLIVGQVGVHTLITSVSYGSLGLAAFYYFKNRESSIKNYLKFGIPGIIAYDIVTGILPGLLLYDQAFMVVLSLQIPFTLNHVLGTIVFSIVISPALYKWIITNKKLEIPFIWNKLSISFK